MAILTVGSGAGFEYSTLASAIAASQDGDVIQVQAGTYTNDFATITTNITIEGVGGMVNLVATDPPPNEKGILTIGTESTSPDVTLDNIAFSGAAIPDGDGGNAAGVRYQAGNLTLNNCNFFDNQDGLLADADPTGNITINNSEFTDNGNDNPPSSGDEHNLYVGDIQQLTVDNSYFYDPLLGNDIQGRAASTTVENSRIDDPNGTGSYEINLSNGGNDVIENNVVEKGPGAGNAVFIGFGESGSVYANSSLTVTGNTVLNDYGASATFVWNDTTLSASVADNTTYGLTANQLTEGAATGSGNTYALQSAEPALDASSPNLPVQAFSFACFRAGTRVAVNLATRGRRGAGGSAIGGAEVRVEDLVVGDTVSTRFEPALRITWIGHRHVDCRHHPDPRKVWPVRVHTGAFGEGQPHRDLWLSPDHAVFVGEVLIPIKRLINGTTIEQVPIDNVTYYHVELPYHDVVLAEGLPVESYLETGGRSAFANGGGPVALFPDFHVRVWEAMGCAPLIVTGPELDAARRLVSARAIVLARTGALSRLLP